MAKRLSQRGQQPRQRNRVRVRIEPGVQRNTSEVYVVSAERPAGSTADVAFTNRSVNTGADALLVDEMLASMSRIAEKGGSVSLLAARDFDAPSRVSLSEDGSGNPVLNLGPTWTVPGRASVVPWSRANGVLKTSTAAWACTTSTWRKSREEGREAWFLQPSVRQRADQGRA
jgi:uncharacterized cupin superfamily protein